MLQDRKRYVDWLFLEPGSTDRNVWFEMSLGGKAGGLNVQAPADTVAALLLSAGTTEVSRTTV
jgi:hypothetical protein